MTSEKEIYINKPLRVYLDDLAARRPAPGGGSAAALSASIGVALMSMVANYTVGNPKYKNVEGEMSQILLKTEKYRTRLQDLVDEDVEAYNRLSSGIKDAGRNSKKLEDVYKKAIEPPFEVCRITNECLVLCRELANHGNKNLITDTAIAAIMLEGAFLSAKFNVYINLKHIKNLKYIEKIHNFLAPLEDELPKLKGWILHRCEEVLQT